MDNCSMPSSARLPADPTLRSRSSRSTKGAALRWWPPAVLILSVLLTFGRTVGYDFVAWDDIVRVCLEVEAFVETEGLYLFSRHRPESYAIPMRAAGGPELLQAIIERGLFPAELAIEAASAAEGLFCWPAEG